ncbi:hypothetical protein NCAS_0A13020 [Naumovozyma castellii]|uniref:Pre-mRNA-splicing factor ISY1 n=1 Tax=Naumovozyma castellii TaxID=27288 RepID=G0V8R1_NAUCA|nr:hypothetical protein NCAS_0A13020 [Naumovozyma castellii CBS 4309]CCC67860.1 hypothetical protein NCAS_0A13020 [Naumovozyma castellii CBS 4309]
MSRNTDKANSLLVRYQEQQAEEQSGYKDYSRYKRPKKVSAVKDLKEALEWKRQVQIEINQKSTRMYDESLNELQLQDLNDELNELIKERSRWNWHISKDLNGGNRIKKDKKLEDATSGKLVDGKRYFGRALQLPEVEEVLLQKKKQKNHPDDDDGDVMIDKSRIPTDHAHSFYYGSGNDKDMDYEALQRYESKWTAVLRGEDQPEAEPEIAAVVVPTLSQMELWLVERRKRKLLEQLDL